MTSAAENLTRAQKEELLLALQELENRKKFSKIDFLYPDTGAFCRDMYPKHMEVFEATYDHSEIIFMAGNRCGKTFSSAYQMALHLTGKYPAWWNGRRFSRPIKAWACGKTGSTTRDIVQKELLGERLELGSGTIPFANIVDWKAKPGIPDGVETVTIKHVSGGQSVLTFKSYDAGVSAFVGTAMDVIWLDELPDDPKIYLECQVRLMTTKGISIVSATPDKGLSQTVLSFWQDGKIHWGESDDGNKYFVNMTWDEAPHLDKEEQERLISQMLPHEREAKIKGIPYLGAGQIYPILEEEYVVAPFEIPRKWIRCAGLDVGWNRTAAAWLAFDKNAGIWYCYSEYYRGQAEPSVHATGIRARGDWVPIAVDPAARGRSQIDGQQLIELYAELGLDVFKANNEVEAGLFTVFEMLSSGKLKIFSTCQNLIGEMRLYRRDENGKIVKKNDHLCDALRYVVMSGRDNAISEPVDTESEYQSHIRDGAADKTTGY
jgi:phage terminase large subunit-like protein